MVRRSIAVVTGSRAEYGLLFWLLKELHADPEVELHLIVTGSHLDDRFGRTVDAIVSDGFTPSAEVAIDIGDTAEATIRSMGQCMTGLAVALDALGPDILVLLGDRYEIFAAAAAAVVTAVPIAHIHGGERTDGAIDEVFRHAITKMAHLHFAAAPAYRDRIVQMGEAPDRVFLVGAPGLDNVEKLPLGGRDWLEKELGFSLAPAFFLLTYHPVTVGIDAQGEDIGAILSALDMFPEFKVIITGVNADPGRDAVAAALEAYAADRPNRVLVHPSLGQVRYLTAVKHTAAVLGNSSSGLIEAPAMGVPTINIGPRQDGRLRAASVIDCAATHDAITASIREALNPAFAARTNRTSPPYGTGGASQRIRDILKSFPLDGILRKPFRDLPSVGISSSVRQHQ